MRGCPAVSTSTATEQLPSGLAPLGWALLGRVPCNQTTFNCLTISWTLPSIMDTSNMIQTSRMWVWGNDTHRAPAILKIATFAVMPATKRSVSCVLCGCLFIEVASDIYWCVNIGNCNQIISTMRYINIKYHSTSKEQARKNVAMRNSNWSYFGYSKEKSA